MIIGNVKARVKIKVRSDSEFARLKATVNKDELIKVVMEREAILFHIVEVLDDDMTMTELRCFSENLAQGRKIHFIPR